MTELFEAAADSNPEPTSAATDKPDKRPRRVITAVVGVVALAGAVCAWLATDHSAAPKTLAAVSTTATATAAPAPSATTATSKLASTLIPLPAGAKPKTTSGIGADGSLSLDQFLKILYPTSTTERALLIKLGFVTAATRSMTTANGQEISIYLAEFGSLGEADYYSLTLAAPLETDPKYEKFTQFSVPAFEAGWGFENPTRDSRGETETSIYGEIGGVAIMVDCYTPGKFDRADLLTLVNNQAARLSSYRTAD